MAQHGKHWIKENILEVGDHLKHEKMMDKNVELGTDRPSTITSFTVFCVAFVHISSHGPLTQSLRQRFRISYLLRRYSQKKSIRE